jgi:hypothetical protein
MDLDETAKELANEFSVFMNPENLSKMTPHVCREGCRHYDPIGDRKAGVSGSSVENRMGL